MKADPISSQLILLNSIMRLKSSIKQISLHETFLILFLPETSNDDSDSSAMTSCININTAQRTFSMERASNLQQKLLSYVVFKYKVVECKAYTLQMGMSTAQFVILHTNHCLTWTTNSIIPPFRSWVEISAAKSAAQVLILILSRIKSSWSAFWFHTR